MTQAEAFLRAIIDNPDDESLRLIYADYLDERGDPRAEFIRVQCALARIPQGDRRREALEARERELLSQVVAPWLGGRLQRFLEDPRTGNPIKEQVHRFAAEQKALPLLLDLG